MNGDTLTLVEGGLVVQTRLSANSNETYGLFLDAGAIRRLTDLEERDEKAGRILEYINEASRVYAPSDNQQSELELAIGFNRMGYGVYGMNAEILRPQIPDDVASRVATRAMRQMAHDLGTYPVKDIPGMVHANISRQYGMTFETNPAASSSMDTDGQDYRPDSERVQLYAHNLYTHEMQLICISGIIALVKATRETQ